MVPTVLVVAGTDSSGGAGVYADQRAVIAAGGSIRCAVTAVTAQPHDAAASIWPVPSDIVSEQLRAAMAKRVDAVKSGMLATAATVRTLAAALKRGRVPYVLDPVLESTRGDRLLEPAAVDVMQRELFPRATLITPNAAEAARLTGQPVRDSAEAEAAGRRLLERGCGAVLITGGHLAEDRGVDVLVTHGRTRRFSGAWHEVAEVRGTGCAYASAIAVRLTQAESLETAIAAARSWLGEQIGKVAAASAGAGTSR